MLDLLGKYIQAFGLLTTLKGDLVIDADDPMAMAEELYTHLCRKADGTLVLGPLQGYELNWYYRSGQTGGWRLLCIKDGKWGLPPDLKLNEVNKITFVSPGGKLHYDFVDVSIRSMRDAERIMELCFHGTKAKP